MQGGEAEEAIEMQLISRYRDYVLFPQEWVSRALAEAKSTGLAATVEG